MNYRFAAILICTSAQLAFSTERPFAFGTARFEENRGQAPAAVRYLARARGQQLFFTRDGVRLVPANGAPVNMSFAGTKAAEWTPAGEPVDSISYYLGSDPSKWVAGAPVYDRILWHGAYPGIDVVFYGREDRVEYDLIVKPGADPSSIRLRFDGSSRMSVDREGAILFSSRGSEMRQRTPEIFQDSPAGRRRIGGRFVAAGSRMVRLELGEYDRSQPLVVDPVLELSTYLGGENDDEIVAQEDGFVAGNTRSLTFLGVSNAQRHGRDIFVRATGPVIPGNFGPTVFLGTVIFGGSGDDEVGGVALYRSGGLSIAGTTSSRDLPSAGQSAYKGGLSDGFLAFVATGSRLSLGSVSYLGGSGEDRVHGFSGLDGAAALAGVTDSFDFPAGNVPQNALRGGKDAFYGVGSLTTGRFVYGYLGGSGDDVAYAATSRAAAGRAFIGGETRSSDFPFTEPGRSGPSDAFLSEIVYTNTIDGLVVTRVTSYRIGGGGEDRITALVARPSTVSSGVGGGTLFSPTANDTVGFAGITTSADLPLRNAAQAAFGGETDAFAGGWDATTASTRWLTYLGGSGPDHATSIAQNWAGDLYVGGWTLSKDLPVKSALQPNSAGGEDGLFAAYESQGTLQHLTYFGGSGDDRIRDVRMIYNSMTRVAGSTTSTDLPQRQIWQDRGQRTDGFVADIGSDFFIGPTEVILAKDGLLNLSVRASRQAYRESVTYRSTDPSRVRLFYLGRAYDEVTAPPEDNIGLEGLAEEGEAAIVVSAAGFAAKTIAVKLFPGAYSPGFSTLNPLSISTWGPALSLSAFYRPVDPATGVPLATSLLLRSGAVPPVFQWSVSDSSILEVVPVANSTFPQLRALKAGESTLTLTVPGYRVVLGERTILAASPRPNPPANTRLGRDLYINLPVWFMFNNAFIDSGNRGTLTARSSDPSRLLISATHDQIGRESVSITIPDRGPVIFGQALAEEGEVTVFLTSSEFEGEVPFTVTLEPSVLAWGPNGVADEVLPQTSLFVGQTTSIVFRPRGQSGSVASGRRPGAPPITVTVTNSNSRSLELSHLTSTLEAFGGGIGLRGMAAGSAELSIAVAGNAMRPAPATVRIDVQAPTPISNLVTSISVGKDLQQGVAFRYQGSAPITVVSDDPNAVLVSASAVERGAAGISLPPQRFSDGYSFFLQSLKSQGEARVRVRFAEGEREIRVPLLPSGAGFINAPGFPASGFDQRQDVAAWALDSATGIGIFPQTPLPGIEIEVKFRSEGSQIRLSRESVVLKTNVDGSVDYTLPPAGQEATLIAETVGNPSSAPSLSRRTLRRPEPPAASTGSSAFITIARDERRMYSIFPPQNLPLTITSNDPQRLLLSAGPSDTPSGTLRLPANAPSVYLHSMGADSGVATLKFEADGRTPTEVKVASQRLTMSGTYGTVAPGATIDATFSVNASAFRAGAGSYRIGVRTANESIATVQPASFEVGGAAGTTGVRLRLTGVAPGATPLVFDLPPEVSVPSAYTVTVTGASPAVIPTYVLGNNLQGSIFIDLGAAFSNPNGAIVSVVSADPSRLVLSRAASTPGSESINVSIPAGERSTQAFFAQALGVGEVSVGVVVDGASQPAAAVRIVQSWFSCGQSLTVPAGSTQTARCSARLNATGTALSGAPRAGLGNVALRFSNSNSTIFTATPETLPMDTGNGELTIRGLRSGTAELLVVQPAGFGPSPDGSDGVVVNVVQPVISGGCSGETVAVGKDMQINCTYNVPSGVSVTAVSESPSMLVSTSQTTAGSRSAAATAASSSGVTFTYQALESHGTAEIVLTAPGYEDRRIAMVLRPVDLFASARVAGEAGLEFPVGGQESIEIFPRLLDGARAIPRAGVTVRAGFSASPTGIVTLQPATVNITTQQSNPSVRVTGTAVGATLIRATSPDGLAVSGLPLAVTVRQ